MCSQSINQYIQCPGFSGLTCVPHVQAFEIPQELEAVHVYLDTIRSRPSWQNTKYSDDLVLSGWKPKLGSG